MKTKPMLGFHSHLVWRRLALAALICGCSIASAQERGDDEEGVVIGTVVIIVADPAEDSGLLRGRKLDEMKWGLMIAKDKVFSFTSKHVDVRSGAEKHFLVKLKAGSYTFEQLAAQGFANFYYPVGITFDVTPAAITYIGKLEILLPYRMNDGPAAYNIVDNQAETVDALKDDHPELAAGVTTDLMALEE